jgi:molybdopterin/thiamine biosynthesis adenylyltransferase
MDKTRQTDIISSQLLNMTTVTMIGTGGIGAATSLALAKLGIPRMYLYDDDTVDDVNIPTQLLKISDIGKLKVSSVGQMLKEFSDEVSGIAIPSRVNADTALYPSTITISSVDSINARKEIWEAVESNQGRWYLDARMGAEVFQLYTVDTADSDWYTDHLSTLNEDDVLEAPCTAKATIYTAFIAAGHIAHQVKRIVMGQPLQRVLIHDIEAMAMVLPGGTITSNQLKGGM